MAEKRAHCPFCGEEVLASAIKCKHCHEWIGEARKKDSSMARAVSRGIKHKNASKIAFKAKLLLLVGAFALVLNIIDRISLRYFHVPIASVKPEWLLTCITIPLLVVAASFVWRFIRQYYEE